MEAKVDVRKLQILNDRINQTLDALNQVRLSVHGLGHTGFAGAQPMNPFGMQQGQGNLGMQQGQGNLGGTGGLGHSNYGQWGQQYGLPYAQSIGGLGHSNQGQWSQQQYGQPFPPAAFAMGGLSHSPFGQINPQSANPAWGVPQADSRLFGQIGGLSHSGFDPIIEQRLADQRAVDPQRLIQTFPYAFAGQSPLAQGQF